MKTKLDKIMILMKLRKRT